MEPDDDYEEPTPEYHNEVTTCRHGMPKSAGCEWCEEDGEDWE